MSQSIRMGIDIGGTHIRLGVVRGTALIRRHQEPIGVNREPEALARRLAALVKTQVQQHETVVHIGIGLPGIVDMASQQVLRSPHFPEWVGVAFGDILRTALDQPVVIDNDANMALRGEMAAGAAKDLCNAVMITLGTGIGGAIMWDRKLLHGDRGFAGEIGHMVIDRNGGPCACGGRGCWELYASSQAFQQPPHTVSDPETWNRFGQHLGLGIASLSNILGITNMIIGGGLSNAWNLFAPAMTQAMTQFTYPEVAAALRVQRAALGEDAALVGAGL